MQKTEYLELNKPERIEFFSVKNNNSNMDLIDAELERQVNMDNEISTRIEKHLADKNNPHGVTVDAIGAAEANHGHSNATTLEAGFMSSSDKDKLDGIEEGAQANVAINDQKPTHTSASSLSALTSGEKLSVAFGKIAKAISSLISHIPTTATASVLGHVKVDSALSDTSTNPVQNKALVAEFANYAKTTLVSSGDFNDIVTPGFYTMKSASANKPASGSYYGLLVLKSDTGNYVEQIAFKESSYEVYIRTLSGTSWSGWEKVFINSKDISSSTSVTDPGKYALDAVQNNASVEGTLANKLAKTYCGTGSATSSNGTFTLTVPAGYTSAIAQLQGGWGAATVVNVALSGTTLSIYTNITGEYAMSFAYMLIK